MTFRISNYRDLESLGNDNCMYMYLYQNLQPINSTFFCELEFVITFLLRLLIIDVVLQICDTYDVDESVQASATSTSRKRRATSSSPSYFTRETMFIVSTTAASIYNSPPRLNVSRNVDIVEDSGNSFINGFMFLGFNLENNFLSLLKIQVMIIAQWQQFTCSQQCCVYQLKIDCK